jgi:hypothetical protein
MEKGILNKLEWYLTFPTPYMFLVRFLKAAISDKEVSKKQKKEEKLFNSSLSEFRKSVTN